MPASSAPCALFAPGCDESSNSCGASLRPRLGTSSSSVPLPRAASAGRRITTSAVASTLPSGLRGACARSVMTALRSSDGLRAMVARAVIRS